jgi:hypothetical protein
MVIGVRNDRRFLARPTGVGKRLYGDSGLVVDHRLAEHGTDVVVLVRDLTPQLQQGPFGDL